MITRILLATDFSERSEAAEAYALSLAKQFSASVVLCHAVEPIIGTQDKDEESDREFDEFYGRLIDRANGQLETRAQQWREGGLSVSYRVEIGNRWRVILNVADADNVDMIVIGRRSFDESAHVPLGTTSQRVYFASRRPVLVVPNHYAGPSVSATST